MNYSPTVHKKAKRKYALLVTLKGLQYGALAGFIASSLISLAIAGAELAFGLPIGTFYSVIGVILGLNNVINASYLGFGLHLLIGILLGIALGAIGIRWEKIRTFMLITYKSSLYALGQALLYG